ncbi:MAG: OmpA family protein [Methyloglobulus sp.]|nr:OmpA family protein [Methyloglobulus sp.]
MSYIFTVLITMFFSTQIVNAVETPAKVAEFESQYEENLYSLKDLTGVYVVLDYVVKATEKSHLTVNPNLQKDVKKRLESAGLKLLNKEEMMDTPGNPELDIFPTFPAHLSAEAGESDSEVAIPNNLTASSHQCCYSSVWGSFSQAAEIERKLGSKYRLSTWGNGSNTDSCDRLGEWMNEATLKIIDNFIADYKKSKEPKKKPQAKPQPAKQDNATTSEATVQVSEPSQKQYIKVKEVDDTKDMTCDTALMIYAQIFKTGSSTISTAKEALLDKLASHMLTCKNYRYRIETHSDKRGSDETNEILSARRGIAINKFLLDKGLEETQFEMRFLDSDKSKSTESEDDVIITPISQQ